MTSQRDKIAIIGIGCRFPGNANSPAAFWDLLRAGTDAITDIPSSRPQLMRVFDPDPSKPGRSYLRKGGFVDGVERWDAGFFGVSPREAMHIDPQHRLLLEVAWEALEDAGQNVDRLAGSRTGVFVGMSTHDYGDIHCDPANRHLLDSHSNSGNATSIAANRISYMYDLRGPSMTVDTACSSSLTATHLACGSLLAGECDLAVVGGAHLVLNPELTIGFCKAAMISPTGECRAFDAAANGYVRSEGAGVVILKPLATALADGDDIYAVIIGSAINQDGRTNGMTVPNPDMQEAMIREALAGAGIAATDLHYVEAHGTGTPVGDPLEAQALGAVLREGRREEDACPIGSVKTNIGHLEAAAGIAGLIKTTLSIHHRQIPASLRFELPHPGIDFRGGRLRVVTALEPWPDGRGPATAAVNSFGFGGANAHILLREAPPPVRVTLPASGCAATLLPMSARSPEALAELARRYMAMLSGANASELVDIASAAARRRAHHDHRLTVVASTREDAIDSLDAALAGETRAALAIGRRNGGKLAFVFSGMGPQWWGMGQQLAAENRVFREMLERCHEALRPHASWGLLDELSRGESTSRIAEPDLAQVTNFAIQVALAEVWKSWGILPEAVVGHSAGEMAAAFTAGVLTLEDAVKVSYHRSRLQSEADPGKIIAVGLGPAQLESILSDYGAALDLAAVNSPVSCTVAGSADAIIALSERLQRDQVFARILSFDVPYHSSKMEPIREELTSVLSDVCARPANIPIISTVTGAWAEGTIFGPSYWFENVRRTVRFADAIGTLIDGGYTTLVEQSPHPVLAASINECLAARKTTATALSSLRKKEDERSALLRTLGVLYTQGRTIKWDGVFGDRRRTVKLPAYPWQRERHWFEPAPEDAHELSAANNAADQHPLLGRRVRAARPLWESSLGGDRLGYLDDHRVQGAVLFPGAAHVEMALAAAHAMRRENSGDPVSLRNIAFKRALFLPDRSRALLQLTLDVAGSHFEVHGASTSGTAGWTLHASGELAAQAEIPGAVRISDIRSRCVTAVSQDACYAALAERSFEYGPAFRGIADLWTGEGEALGRIDAPTIDPGGYHLHPALLDAAFQLLVSAGGDESIADGSDDHSDVYLPVQLRELTVYAPTGTSFWAHARIVSLNRAAIEGDIHLIDDEGRVLASALGFRGQRIEQAAGSETLKDWLYEYRWENRPLSSSIERSVLARSIEDVAERMRPRIEALSAEWRWSEYYTNVEPRLTELTLAYMTQAVRQLGGSDPFSLDSLGVPARRRRLGEHVLGVLEAHGVLRRESEQWRMEPPTDAKAAWQIGRDITADCPAHALDVEMLMLCGSHLADVMSGRVDSGSVMFSGDGFDLLTRFYMEAPPSRFYNLMAASVIAEAAAGRDETRPLRVLEIGGGTGSTTALVLPAIGAGVEFVFTDITPFFTEQAKAKFGGHAGFSARTFDVERDSAVQGFPPHSFDIVFAANVLHGMPSLAASLANVKRLLAPGGALVLLEITRRPIWTDLIFGLTDGWWRFEDHEVRASHALLSGAAWKKVLESAGFESAAVISDFDHEGEPAQSTLAASAPVIPREEHAAARGSDAGDWLIFAGRSGVGAALEARLIAAGSRVTIVEPGGTFLRRDDGRFELPMDNAAAVAELFAALDASSRQPRAVVHLCALDSGDEESMQPDDLLETQRPGVGSCLAIVKALAARSAALPELWLITGGAQPVESGEMIATTQAPLWGFGRVVTKEHPGLRTRLIDIGAHSEAEIEALAREALSGEWEDELALRGDARYVRRLQRFSLENAVRGPGHTPQTDESYRAEVGMAGALESLTWRPVAHCSPGPDEVEIKVRAAGMNFRDVMIALGLYPNLPGEASFSRGLLGLDCAGTITACGTGVSEFAVGDEVVGIAPGTLGAYVTTPAALIAKRPASLSVTQGAAVSGVFVTAYYSLIYLARLRRGERVLIHSATGGVGLAAIQIAREVGAEIFATAGSAAKRAYLASLGIEKVMDSRTLRFADEIMEITHGEGVDVVLNSLAGEAIARGIAVLRDCGRFVEIGKRDIYQDSQIGLLAFRKNLSFFGVDVDRLTHEHLDVSRDMLREVITRFERGVFTPLPERVFGASKLEDAMRFMGQAKHIGKVVVSMEDPEVVVAAASRAVGALFRGDATYLITGGLGGFGLAVANWMAREGAVNFALIGRGGAGADAEGRVQELRNRGARVEMIRADVSRADDVRRALAEVRATMPPLRGIFHAAMVLGDAPIVELDRERMERVMAPKINGAWRLHCETLTDDLDCFVLFSSITSMFGNPLQSNYAAANSYLDALAHRRRALGRPALSINWGAVSKVGYVSRHKEVSDYLEWLGWHAFSPSQAFEVLGGLLRRDATHVMAARVDWKRWAESSPAAVASAMLHHFVPAAGASSVQNAETGSPRAAILAVAAPGRRALVISFLREKVGKVLGHSPSKLTVDRPLNELGFDSLIAVELMTILRVDLGVELAAVKLLQGVTIDGIATLALEQLGAGAAGAATAKPVTGPVEEGAVSVIVNAAPVVAEAAMAAAAGGTAKSSSQLSVRSNGDRNRASHDETAVLSPAAPGSVYATLDYSRWTGRQRVVRGLVTAGMRALTRIRVEGMENVPRAGGCLLAINHLSLADTPLVLSVLPRRAIMFASVHLQSSSFMNWFLHDIGEAIYIRRGEGDADALANGLAVLAAGGMLGLSPEGKRSLNGALARGHTGVAYLATQANVPVIPLAAWGQELMSGHWKSMRRAPISVRIGPPIRFTNAEPDAMRLREYTDQVMTAIAAMLPPEYRGVYADAVRS